jgi:signal transduction histidine kinase
VCRREQRFARKDGATVWVDATDSPVRGGDGRVKFFVGMAVDITGRKRAEAEREELHRQVLASREQLQVLSRRLIEGQEEERRRLAGELHDEIGQILTAVSLNLEATRAVAGPAAHHHLDESLRAVDRAIEQVRTLALNLRPTMLDVMGLESAARWYIDRQLGPSGLAVELVSTLSGARVARELETACFRVMQEALTNVIRHARATTVRIELRCADGALHLVIADDGAGFDVAAAQRRAREGETFGLLGMQERVQLLGGEIQIRSTPGNGTVVQVRLPLR